MIKLEFPPGVLCITCSAQVNSSFKWGTKVYHPAGRDCGKMDSKS